MHYYLRLFSSFVLIALFSASLVFGQNQRPEVDVIYLKNGGERKGQIIERKPGESIKIETVNGQVFVYKLSEVERIVRGRRTTGSKNQENQNQEKISKKSPFLAFGLSLLFTGGGQYYNGQYVKGGILTGLAITGGSLIGAADYNDEGMLRTGTVMILGSALYSIIDAPIVAGNINDRARQQSRYGHLMEFQGKKYTVGLDPVQSRQGRGVKLAVHF